MKYLVLSFFLFIVSIGCVNLNSVFEDKDVSFPCSIVNSTQIEKLCGINGVQSIENKVGKFCMYSKEKNGESEFFMNIIFIPVTGSYYNARNQFIVNNQSIKSILKENLGLGDSSFLVTNIDKEKNETLQTSLAIFKGNSAFTVIVNNNICADKISEIGQIVLDKLKKNKK